LATIAIATVTLTRSSVVPIRVFGLIASAGTMLGLALVLAFIPGTLAVWRPNLQPVVAAGAPGGNGLRGHPGRHAWSWLSGWLARYHLSAIALAVLVMAGVAWGVPFLKTSVRLETLFPSDSRVIEDYAWFEDQVGPLAPLEVILHCEPKCPLDLPERLALLKRLQGELKQINGIGTTLSAVTFLPRLPSPGGDVPEDLRETVNETLERARPIFSGMHLLHESSAGE